MTGNKMMNYYVRPWHLYSHSRTCTRSSFCRRPSRLVTSLICYLLDRASVHKISALVTWFQYMLDISSFYGDLDPLYIFSFHGDHDPVYIFIMVILSFLWLYVEMTTHVIFCIMPIHGHCNLMYPRLMYVPAVTSRDICTILLDGWFFITPLLWCNYNVFQLSYHPSDLTH